MIKLTMTLLIILLAIANTNVKAVSQLIREREQNKLYYSTGEIDAYGSLAREIIQNQLYFQPICKN